MGGRGIFFAVVALVYGTETILQRVDLMLDKKERLKPFMKAILIFSYFVFPVKTTQNCLT